MATRISVDLADELYRRVKIHCATEGITIMELVRKLLEERLDKVEKKQQKR